MKQQRMRPARRYERLSWLRDFKVDKHQVDPRGWHVVAQDGRTAGVVKDLIVDTERMTGAYLDVELDRKLFDLHEDPRVFIPMARAHRDGSHHRLIVDGLTRDRVANLYAARWEHDRRFWDTWWNADSNVAATMAPTTAAAATPDELRRALDDVQPGESVRIPVIKEEIVVERRPVADDTLVVRDK